METFIAVLHIVVALILVALVLVQDSKSSAGGVFGAGGSNTVLGATGAATLAQKLTRYTAIVFAVTSVLLTLYSSRHGTSVMDNLPAATSSAPQSAPAAAPAATSTDAKANTAPAAAAGTAAPATAAPATAAPATAAPATAAPSK